MQEGPPGGPIGGVIHISQSETRSEERALYCSISMCDIEDDHVATSNGQVYERSEIERWLVSNVNDPNTRDDLAIRHLISIGESERTCLSPKAIRGLVRSFWLKFEMTRCYMLDRGVVANMPSGRFVRRSLSGRFFHGRDLSLPEGVSLDGCVFRDCSFGRTRRVQFRNCRFEGRSMFALLEDSYFVGCSYGELREAPLVGVAICERAVIVGHSIFESEEATCIRSPRLTLGKNRLFMRKKLALAAKLLVADDEYSLVLQRPTTQSFLRFLLEERQPEKTYLYALFSEGFTPGELACLDEETRETVRAFAETLVALGDERTLKCAEGVLGGALSQARVL